MLAPARRRAALSGNCRVVGDKHLHGRRCRPPGHCEAGSRSWFGGIRVNQDVKLLEGHPSEDQLLLTLEGEVAGEEAARVQQHVAGCWSCKARYEEMQRGILAFVEYREKRYLPALEAPSGSSSGFRTRLRAMINEVAPAPFLAKCRRNLASFWRPFQLVQLRWVSVVAAAMAALLLWTEVLSPPPVSASELLTRAIAAQKPASVESNHVIRQTLLI